MIDWRAAFSAMVPHVIMRSSRNSAQFSRVRDLVRRQVEFKGAPRKIPRPAENTQAFGMTPRLVYRAQLSQHLRLPKLWVLSVSSGIKAS